MKKVLSLPLSEAEMLELWRVIVERDEAAGMDFLLKDRRRRPAGQVLPRARRAPAPR